MLKSFGLGVVVGGGLVIGAALHAGGETIMQLGARMVGATTRYDWVMRPVGPMLNDESVYAQHTNPLPRAAQKVRK